MADGAIGQEILHVQGDAREIRDEYLKRGSLSGREQAYRDFFAIETDFLGAIINTKLLPGQGRNETVLTGKWKYDSDKRIFLRIGCDSSGLVVAADAGDVQPMVFSIRTDISNNDGGYFYAENVSRSSLRRIDPLIERVVRGVRGYEERNFSRGLSLD